MVRQTSREQRSARREAMRKSTGGRIMKSTRTTKPLSSTNDPSNETIDKRSPESAMLEDSSSTANEKKSGPPASKTKITYSDPLSKDELCPNSSAELSVSTPPYLDPSDSSESDDLLPASSCQYRDLTPPISPIPDIDEASDSDLEKYLSEFEAASQGEIPDDESNTNDLLTKINDVHANAVDLKQETPLSLETIESEEFLASLDLQRYNTGDYSLPPHFEDQYIDSMDQFVTFGDNTVDLTSNEGIDIKSRKAPLCIYRPIMQTCPVSHSFNPNKRTLLAALETVAADSNYVSREAYVQSVILAAASLKQRSMVTGLARQTMAPALGTSH